MNPRFAKLKRVRNNDERLFEEFHDRVRLMQRREIRQNRRLTFAFFVLVASLAIVLFIWI